MRRYLGSITPRLGTLLAGVSLLLVMTAAGGQAAPVQQGGQAQPVAAEATKAARFSGGCYYTSTSAGFSAYVSVFSDRSGKGYVNLYLRSQGKDILIRHMEKTGTYIYLVIKYPYRTGYWFATWGFNGPDGNLSNGERCLRS